MESQSTLERGQLNGSEINNDSPSDRTYLHTEEAKEQVDANLVDWDGPDDPENPQNFSVLRKWMITLNMGVMAFCATFSSSVFSTATMATASEFDVSQEVMTLGTSVFVLVSDLSTYNSSQSRQHIID